MAEKIAPAVKPGEILSGNGDASAITSPKNAASREFGRQSASPKLRASNTIRVAKVDPEPKKTGGGKKRLFPKHTLEEALRVPQSLKAKNGGEPMSPEEVARAVELSVKTDEFFYLAASSQMYGLTNGTRTSPEIALSDLGREIVYAESAEQQHKSKIQAFFRVQVFKAVFEHYKGGTLPEMEFLSGKLRKLDLLEKDHSSFADLFKKNYDYLKLSSGFEQLQQETSASGSFVTVVGQKTGSYQHTAFVIMPFSEKGTNPRSKGFFKELLGSVITPACNACNFRVATADISGSDLIHHTIMKNLIEADLVIADLTDHNPNVAFELGVRIALDKPVAIIRAQGMGPFFDVDNVMRVFEYNPCLWPTTIENDLPKLTDHIRATWHNWGKLPSYMKILTADPHALSQAQANGTPIVVSSL